MKILKRLSLVSGTVLIVSCASVPHFPPVECKALIPIEKGSIVCSQEENKCITSMDNMLNIFRNYQYKSECLEQYKAGASKFH